MHLTLINFFKKTVPGSLFRGKRRLVKKVTMKSMKQLEQEYQLQERNMLYLRHPYITFVSFSRHGCKGKNIELNLYFRNNRKVMLKSSKKLKKK